MIFKKIFVLLGILSGIKHFSDGLYNFCADSSIWNIYFSTSSSFEVIFFCDRLSLIVDFVAWLLSRNWLTDSAKLMKQWTCKTSFRMFYLRIFRFSNVVSNVPYYRDIQAGRRRTLTELQFLLLQPFASSKTAASSYSTLVGGGHSLDVHFRKLSSHCSISNLKALCQWLNIISSSIKQIGFSRRYKLILIILGLGSRKYRHVVK